MVRVCRGESRHTYCAAATIAKIADPRSFTGSRQRTVGIVDFLQGQKSSVILSIDSPAFHESFSFDDFAKVAQADCRSLTHQISPHVPHRVWQQKGNLEISVWDHAHNVGNSKMLSRHGTRSAYKPTVILLGPGERTVYCSDRSSTSPTFTMQRISRFRHSGESVTALR